MKEAREVGSVNLTGGSGFFPEGGGVSGDPPVPARDAVLRGTGLKAIALLQQTQCNREPLSS